MSVNLHFPGGGRCPNNLRMEEHQQSFLHHPKSFTDKSTMKPLTSLYNQLKTDFDQPGYQIYCCLEKLLENVATGKSYSQELDQMLDMYSTDLNAPNLQGQLEIPSSNLPNDVINLAGMKEHLQRMSHAEKSHLSMVILVMKLILVMPATNASSKRSFSALRRVKSYLRSTMTQE